jgi:hypothetical protein
LWNKKDLTPGFNLYLFDKNKVRIGDGWITLDNLTPGQAVKFQTTVHALGTPASVELVANSVPAELHAKSPKRPSTPEAPTASFPPPPLRLLPGGANPVSRAGLSPAVDQRLFTAHAKSRFGRSLRGAFRGLRK